MTRIKAHRYFCHPRSVSKLSPLDDNPYQPTTRLRDTFTSRLERRLETEKQSVYVTLFSSRTGTAQRNIRCWWGIRPERFGNRSRFCRVIDSRRSRFFLASPTCRGSGPAAFYSRAAPRASDKVLSTHVRATYATRGPRYRDRNCATRVYLFLRGAIRARAHTHARERLLVACQKRGGSTRRRDEPSSWSFRKFGGGQIGTSDPVASSTELARRPPLHICRRGPRGTKIAALLTRFLLPAILTLSRCADGHCSSPAIVSSQQLAR